MQQLAHKLHTMLESPDCRRRWSWFPFGLALVLWLVMGYQLHRIGVQHRASESAAAALVAALDMSQTAIVVSDCNGHITSANAAAVKLFGGELLGRSVHDFCGADSRTGADAAYRTALDAVRATGQPLITQTDVHIVNGKHTVAAQLVVRVTERGDACPLVVASITPLAVISNVAPDGTRIGAPLPTK